MLARGPKQDFVDVDFVRLAHRESFIVSVSGSNETKARVVLLSINVAVITLSSTFSLIFILCAFSEDALVGKFGKAVSAVLLSAPQPP